MDFVAQHWIAIVVTIAIAVYVLYHHRRERRVDALAGWLGSMTMELLSAHSHCRDNRMSLFTSEVCGCFRCCRTYSSSEVKKFVEQTAHCPYCNRDAVIGDASGLQITDEFLHDMNTAWFSGQVWPAPRNDGSPDPD